LEQIRTAGTVTGWDSYCADLLLVTLKYDAWLFYGRDVGLGLTARCDASAPAIQTAAGALRYTMWDQEGLFGEEESLIRLAQRCFPSWMLDDHSHVLALYPGAKKLAQRLRAGKTWCPHLGAEVSQQLTEHELSVARTVEDWAILLSFVETARAGVSARAGG
jgi:hypothetical protein